MNDLIKERDERTKRRKKFKKRIDSEYNLAFKDDEKMMLSGNTMNLKAKSVRLLDEGAVVGDEYVDFIIRKGTLEKFLNGENKFLPNLTDDFVGTVNLGHMDFATFPFIIGEWTKKDLTLVDIGDDRYGIDVKVKLDKSSVFVQELKRQPYDIGISSEFYYNIDWQATEDIGILVIDEVYIFAYGLVGECGNVNSSGLELKGDFEMKDTVKINLEVEGLDEVTENLEELSNEVEGAEIGDDTIEDIVAEVEAEMNEADEDEDDSEDETELPTEELSATNEDANSEDTDNDELENDEASNEEVSESEPENDEATDEEVEIEDVVELALSDLRNQVASLRTENDNLKENIAALKKSNNRLSKKLADEKDKKASFIAKFSSMAEKMGVDDAPKSNDKADADYVYGDGIGE